MISRARRLLVVSRPRASQLHILLDSRITTVLLAGFNIASHRKVRIIFPRVSERTSTIQTATSRISVPSDHVHALHDLSEHDVLPVQLASGHGAEKELGSIRPGASVRHGQHARAIMLQFGTLVHELHSIDRLPACSVAPGKISAQTDGAWNETVKESCSPSNSKASQTFRRPSLQCREREHSPQSSE